MGKMGRARQSQTVALQNGMSDFMRISMALCLVAVAAFAPPASATPPARPSVLFIAVDDLNDWINCLGGQKNVHTPNLDRLTKRGVLFSNARCAAPSCTPSRVAMMTGVAPVLMMNMR